MSPDYPRIYLQPNEAGIGRHTWCQDRIKDTDIEYIRSDIADELMELLVEIDRRVIFDPSTGFDRAFSERVEAVLAKAGGQP